MAARSTTPIAARTALASKSCAPDVWDRLRALLPAALADLRQGRAALRQLLADFDACDDGAGSWVAGAALVVTIGIADDDYLGFNDAVAAVLDTTPAARERVDDPSLQLLGWSGDLVARWFESLDDPQLAPLAQRIVGRLHDRRLDVSVRVCAGIATLHYFDHLRDLEKLLWVALAMRDVLADSALSARLRDEWHCGWVESLYMYGDSQRSQAVRRQRSESGVALEPAANLKLRLLDAQIAIGDGDVDAGRSILVEIEPMLDMNAAHHAALWHLFSSRLAMLDARLSDALAHARLALRLSTDCSYPERWLGVTVMQEGQVQVARAEPMAAVPFFERAGRVSSGAQAQYCWCLAHFARALGHEQAGSREATREELASGFALARQLQWTAFFRAIPAAAAALCALALEHDVQADFVRSVIAARGLDGVRTDLAAWPWPVRVRTLGRFELEIRDQVLSLRGKVAHKPLEVLQFIIVSGGQQVATRSVEFALWPELEGDKARAALKIALHRLRKLLGDESSVLLDAGRFSLNPKTVWVDCLAFESQANRVTTPLDASGVVAAERANALYRGAFLGDDEDHAWQMVHRARLESKWKRTVFALAQHWRAAGDATRARSLLERALEIDPMAEELVRELMQLLIDAGERAAALRAYERCRAMLARILLAQPSAATLSLMERLSALPPTP